MSGIALLAKALGHEVAGSDANIYPPMSNQLSEQGITLKLGYDSEHIEEDVECVIVGNVIKRGNKAIEAILAKRIPFISGPQWLYENVLKNKIVLAVAGTHGKTTTTSLLAFILEKAGLSPGFLIGGVPENFQVSSRLGKSAYFVIEGDEYDSAFFDKRAKFIHYLPQILILNNLEYDHADIFPNLDSIKQQFHYLIRTVPANGCIIYQHQDINLKEVLDRGCWTPLISFGDNQADWQAEIIHPDGSLFILKHKEVVLGRVEWNLVGKHNVANALAAIAAAHHVGVDPKLAIEALHHFINVKRRLEVKGNPQNITIYDDFAHHPTAIKTTLDGLRAKVGPNARVIVVLAFESYTMRKGMHKTKIPSSLASADMVVCKKPADDWGISAMLDDIHKPTHLYATVDELILHLVPLLKSGDHVITMSNGGFDNIHEKLVHAIEKGLT